MFQGDVEATAQRQGKEGHISMWSWDKRKHRLEAATMLQMLQTMFDYL